MFSADPRYTEQKLYFYVEKLEEGTGEIWRTSVQNYYVAQGGMDKVTITGGKRWQKQI